MNNTNLLKGIGILLIIFHNYAHWLPQCVAENEYTFSTERIGQLVAYLCSGGPHVLLNILSHYGHYGVAIFLFLSGYGLVKKYEHGQSATRRSFADKCLWAIKFLWQHALKLWNLMLPALLLFVAIELYLGTWNRPWSRLLPLVGFYSNLMPERDLILGPWWWFGLMMQFYVLWLLLIYKRGKAVLFTMMGVCLTAMLAMTWLEHSVLDSEKTITCWMHYNFPASMLAFGLGVAHARYGLKWLCQPWSPLVGGLVVILGSFNAGIWTLAPAGAIMCVAWLMGSPENKTPVNNNNTKRITLSWRNALIWIGGISAWLFALHPVVRAYTIGMARQGSEPMLYLSVLVFVGASIALAWLFTFITRKKHKPSDR